jgi:hypothetical protein
LSEVKPEHRPRGVVFVDLDSDVIHLGYEDSGNRVRDVPCLPERQAMKLKAKLVEFASTVYVKPATDKSSMITCGAGERLPVSRRPSYVGLNESPTTRTKIRRRELLAQTDKAYRESDLQVPLSGFLTEDGQLISQDFTSPGQKKGSGVRPLRRLARSRSHDSLDMLVRDTRVESQGLLDLDEVCNCTIPFKVPGVRPVFTHAMSCIQPDGFSTKEIRDAFLRFFVALLQNYRSYFNEAEFQAVEFVQSLSLSPNSFEFCQDFVKTQLFHRFLEERRELSDPEVRFFDESINAKVNRSKKNALMSFGRVEVKDTTFLDDASRVVSFCVARSVVICMYWMKN